MRAGLQGCDSPRNARRKDTTTLKSEPIAGDGPSGWTPRAADRSGFPVSAPVRAGAARLDRLPTDHFVCGMFDLLPYPMDSTTFNLGSILLGLSGLFVLATLFFGTKGGYYDTDDYDGNGTAH